MKDIFKKERETYEESLKQLINENLGEYVLIKNQDIIGIFDTFSDAVEAGKATFPGEAVYVREIKNSDNPVMFYSNLVLA